MKQIEAASGRQERNMITFLMLISFVLFFMLHKSINKINELNNYIDDLVNRIYELENYPNEGEEE